MRTCRLAAVSSIESKVVRLDDEETTTRRKSREGGDDPVSEQQQQQLGESPVSCKLAWSRYTGLSLQARHRRTATSRDDFGVTRARLSIFVSNISKAIRERLFVRNRMPSEQAVSMCSHIFFTFVLYIYTLCVVSRNVARGRHVICRMFYSSLSLRFGSSSSPGYIYPRETRWKFSGTHDMTADSLSLYYYYCRFKSRSCAI